MNIGGVYFAHNNLPESNAQVHRQFTQKKEQRDIDQEWLQVKFETYSRYLHHFQQQLKDATLPERINELNSLVEDARSVLNDIRAKMH